MENNIEELAKEIRLLPEKEQQKIVKNLLKSLTKDENKSSQKKGELMPLQKYMDCEVDELTNSKPMQLVINGAEHRNFGSTWTSFMIHCVNHFIKQGDIPKDFEPVSSGRDKLILIPSLSKNNDGKDHKFDEVTPFCYVDTKYNVKGQLKNLITIMRKFCIEQDYKIELAIYWDK